MKNFLLIVFCVLGIAAQAQDSNGLTIGAYADAYYSWYSGADAPARQIHEGIGAYHNNLGLNVAQATMAYKSDKMRGVATLHFGDIPGIAWGDNYRNVQEANAGFRLAKGLWLDAGFFKTHVGTESFLPKDNLMSIITLGTFYGPFYQSGARLSYSTESEWRFELHAINGYNRHIDNNNTKTFGVLVSKKFSDRFFMSYSNMIGNERLIASSQEEFLIYQNIYVNFTGESVELQIGIDVAITDDGTDGESFGEPLLAPLITYKYHFNDRFAVAARAEMFSDEGQVNSTAIRPVLRNTDNDPELESAFEYGLGQTVFGGTFSFEYKPSDIGFLRLESRYLYDPNGGDFPPGYTAEFLGVNPMTENRVQVMATLGIYFDKTFKLKK